MMKEHKCHHGLLKKSGKLSLILILGHLMVHEIPMVILGSWALTEHCAHHHGEVEE